MNPRHTPDDIEPRSIETETTDDDRDVRRVDLGEVDFETYRLLVSAVGRLAAQALMASNGDTNSKAFGDYETLTAFSLGLITADVEWGQRLTVDEDALVEQGTPDDVLDAIDVERVDGELVRQMNDAVDIEVGGTDE